MTQPEFWPLHEAACARGETAYLDPETGFTVFTRLGLLARERCCGAGCRHCPYGHESVPVKRRAARIQQPAWLSDIRPDPLRETAHLFWSGGRDSFLAFRAMVNEGRFAPVLLTTFDPKSRELPNQGLGIIEVAEQAESLGLPLIGVPLHQGADYAAQLLPALDLAPDAAHVYLPDLGLEPIREWREETFANNPRTAELTLHFPLWEREYGTLLDDLAASGERCEVSAVAEGVSGVSLGARFDAEFIADLPAGVDAFGLGGEFCTKMVFQSPGGPEPK